MKTREELLKLSEEVIKEAIHLGLEESLHINMIDLSSDEKCLLTNYAFTLKKVVNELFDGKIKFRKLTNEELNELQNREIKPTEEELFEEKVA